MDNEMQSAKRMVPEEEDIRLLAEAIISNEYVNLLAGIQFPDGSVRIFTIGNDIILRGFAETALDIVKLKQQSR